MLRQETSQLQITGKKRVADAIVEVELMHPLGRRLPDWTPGSHLDIVLPTGESRQYSLCGDRWDTQRYRIAVLRDPDGRGGSVYIHDELEVGDLLGIGGPRNNFAMVPSSRYLFIAGGIGITPMLPMIAQADLMDADWQLLYLGHDRRTMAFLDDVHDYDDRVVVRPKSETGSTDLAPWIADAAASGAKVYACGPERLIDTVDALCSTWPAGALRTERFTPKVQGPPVRSTPFAVTLDRTGVTVTVPPGRSVLDAVRDAGASVLSSCREGTCGTCETRVLSGTPDHRDSLLDDSDRATTECMYLCVSRSCTDDLVLDL